MRRIGYITQTQTAAHRQPCGHALMGFNYRPSFGARSLSAYETLLADAMAGGPTLDANGRAWLRRAGRQCSQFWTAGPNRSSSSRIMRRAVGGRRRPLRCPPGMRRERRAFCLENNAGSESIIRRMAPAVRGWWSRTCLWFFGARTHVGSIGRISSLQRECDRVGDLASGRMTGWRQLIAETLDTRRNPVPPRHISLPQAGYGGPTPSVKIVLF